IKRDLAALEVVARRDLTSRLIERVDELLLVEVAHDVERAVRCHRLLPSFASRDAPLDDLGNLAHEADADAVDRDAHDAGVADADAQRVARLQLDDIAILRVASGYVPHHHPIVLEEEVRLAAADLECRYQPRGRGHGDLPDDWLGVRTAHDKLPRSRREIDGAVERAVGRDGQ